MKKENQKNSPTNKMMNTLESSRVLKTLNSLTQKQKPKQNKTLNKHDPARFTLWVARGAIASYVMLTLIFKIREEKMTLALLILALAFAPWERRLRLR